MIAVNWSMPNMPRFDTEKVEPVYSSRRELALARPLGEVARFCAEISRSDFRSASKMTGVISPSSMATAMPR